MFAPISREQRNKSGGTNRRCINAPRKSASAKFKTPAGRYLCIGKSINAGGSAAKWFSRVFLEENAVKKRRPQTAEATPAENREIVGAQVFTADRNFANGLLMRCDLRGTAVGVLMDNSCNFCAKLNGTAARSRRSYHEARDKNTIDAHAKKKKKKETAVSRRNAIYSRVFVPR